MRTAAGLLVAIIALVAASPVRAGVVTVTSTADSGMGSLRAALAAASAGDTIQFNVALPATITLTTDPLTIDLPLTISGPGADLLTISGGGAFRVFLVQSGGTSTIEGLRIADGSSNEGAGIWLRSSTTLVLRDCRVEDNLAVGNAPAGPARGGGLLATQGSNLLVERCLFVGNRAESPTNDGGAGVLALGGGMGVVEGPPSVVIRDSTFSENVALGGKTSASGQHGGEVAGGGLFLDAAMTDLTIERCLFESNEATGGASASGTGGHAAGGGLLVYGSPGASVRSSTFWGNLATAGAGSAPGVSSGGGLTAESTPLVGLTLSENAADMGGGLRISGGSLRKSIVSANQATSGGVDVDVKPASPPVSLGDNLVSAPPIGNFGALGSDDAGNGTDPLLGGLGSYGGSTLTLPLLAGSPARDVVPLADCAAETDQRGVALPQGDFCDIGAFEVEVPFFFDGFESGDLLGWTSSAP